MGISGRSDRYDVMVIGAGPAGSAFVRTLHQTCPDARVLVIDKAVFPRDKVCGDALTHTSSPLVTEIFPELSGRLPTRSATRRYTLRYPNGRTFSRTDQELDVIPRRIFDDLLWTAARHDKVDFVDGARVIDVILGDSGRLEGVVAKVGDDTTTFRADVVVAADGSNSMVRRKTRSGPGDTPPIAVRQYVHDVPATDDGLVFIVDPDHHGYFWFFPIATDDGWSANIGWFGFGEGPRREPNPRARLEDHLANDEVVRRYIGGGRREGTVQGFPLSLAPLSSGRITPARPLWGDGYLLLGDAAGMIHPFTGEGIAFALQSGRRAAELLAGSSDLAELGPRYQTDVVSFAEEVYSITRTNLLFRVPCTLPAPLRAPYLAALPAIDRSRKAAKRGLFAARSVVSRS